MSHLKVRYPSTYHKIVKQEAELLIQSVKLLASSHTTIEEILKDVYQCALELNRDSFLEQFSDSLKESINHASDNT